MDTYSTGTTSSGSVATRGTFTENTRVQIPAALHLVRLGYEYLSLFSNNDENNEDGQVPISEAFYATVSKNGVVKPQSDRK